MRFLGPMVMRRPRSSHFISSITDDSFIEQELNRVIGFRRRTTPFSALMMRCRAGQAVAERPSLESLKNPHYWTFIRVSLLPRSAGNSICHRFRYIADIEYCRTSSSSGNFPHRNKLFERQLPVWPVAATTKLLNILPACG